MKNIFDEVEKKRIAEDAKIDHLAINVYNDIIKLAPFGHQVSSRDVGHLARSLWKAGYRSAKDINKDDLRTALHNLLNMYLNLINSGDCGNWDPEKEAEVIDARAALKGNVINYDEVNKLQDRIKLLEDAATNSHKVFASEIESLHKRIKELE